jgi:DNA-binding GntR family transcriptional regulator
MSARKSAKPAAAPAPGGLLTAAELPRRSVLADSTYETIKQLIMDSRLAPGARISMDGLARDLDVSPTPVREALARLDAEGLVRKRPLAGYTVSPQLDQAAFEDLFRMRLLLEPEAARLAAGHPGELAGLAESGRRLPDVPAGQGYAAYRAHVELDARFHDTIAAASGSPLLREAITRLRAHMHLYRLYWRTGIAADTNDEHHRIAAALTAGDSRAAAAAMRAHLRSSHDRLAPFARE